MDFSVALPLSPRCEGCCYVVLTCSGVVTGTAFAVSDKILLTAFHCLGKSRYYFIAPSVTRSNAGSLDYPSGRSKVKVVARGGLQNDVYYAVLEMVNKRTSSSDYWPITLTPIPIFTQPIHIEDSVKVYFAFRAKEFNGLSRDTCSIGVHSYEKITSVTAHHIENDRGFFYGCSGGPYVINDRGVGKVVALHIESDNSIPDVAISPQSTDMDSEIASLREAMSEASNNHSSVAQGLIISKCKELCEVLRTKGVTV